MCFSLSVSILKPDSVTYVPDIKNICFANYHDFPLERVPRRAPAKVSHELPCHWAYAKPVVFWFSANTVLFCPTGHADKISSDTIIWSVFNKKSWRGWRGHADQIQKAASGLGAHAESSSPTLHTQWRAASGLPHIQKKGPSKRGPVGFLLESSRGIIGSDKTQTYKCFVIFIALWFQKYFPICFLYRLFCEILHQSLIHDITNIDWEISKTFMRLWTSHEALRMMTSNVKQWYNWLIMYIKLNAFEGYCKIVLRLMRLEHGLFRESTVTVETLECIEL